MPLYVALRHSCTAARSVRICNQSMTAAGATWSAGKAILQCSSSPLTNRRWSGPNAPKYALVTSLKLCPAIRCAPQRQRPAVLFDSRWDDSQPLLFEGLSRFKLLKHDTDDELYKRPDHLGRWIIRCALWTVHVGRCLTINMMQLLIFPDPGMLPREWQNLGCAAHCVVAPVAQREAQFRGPTPCSKRTSISRFRRSGLINPRSALVLAVEPPPCGQRCSRPKFSVDGGGNMECPETANRLRIGFRAIAVTQPALT